MKSSLLLVALLAPFSALAETTATPMDPVVVTATRNATPLSDTLASTLVITRREIERAQATDVTDVLRFFAGIDLGRSGGPGQVTSLFIRGGESNHTLVLIDGQRVNPTTAGGAALQNLSLTAVERIEVVKGPRASLYGSDAIAGVVNIITRAGGDKFQGEAQFRGGSGRTFEESGAVSGKLGAARLSLETAHLETDGIPSCEGSTLDRGFRNTTVNARGAVALGGVDLSARFYNAEGNAEYLNSCGNAEFDRQPLDQNFQNQTAAIEAGFHPTSAWDSRLSIRRMVDDIQQNQENYLGERDYVKTVRPGVDWHNSFSVGETQRLSASLEAAREEVDALSFGTRIAEDRDLYAVSAQDEIHWQRHRGLLAARFEDHDAFGSKTTWNAEYGFELFASSRLIAAAGTGFRAPDASDRFGFGGNPDLRPEEAVNYELGLHQLIGTTQTLDLRVFRNDVKDLISVEFSPDNDPDTDFGFRAVNIDRARNQGVELTYRLEVGNSSVTLTGIAQDPEDRADGSRLLRRAKRSAALKMSHRWGPADIGVDLLASGDRADVGGVTDGGYALINLIGGYRLGEHWQLRTRIENLLDKDYQTAAGYNQPGLSAYGTVRYSY